MKKALVLILGVCFVALLIGSVSAREAVNPGLRVMKTAENNAVNSVDPGLRGLYEQAAVDTYCLVWYTFEQMNWQGWTRVDNTAQVATFWHVDDFAGLGGGSFGRLHAIEGTKSMWCGARPNLSDPYLCSWLRAPGYGNGWSQNLATAAFSFTGIIRLKFHCKYDSEPDYDFTRVQYDAGSFNWQNIAEYTAHGDTVGDYVLNLTQARTKIRFHFTSDGAWSDQDGLWNTDGGSIVDSISLRDNAALNNLETFESYAVGATTGGIWIGAPEPAFGKYSGLKNNLADKDPCGDNFATQVVFFIGSPNPSSSYPGLYDTPFCAGAGGITAPCQDEMIVSPLIDMTYYSSACSNVQNTAIPSGDLPLLGGAILRFTVYRDIPLANLVFYQWHVRQWAGGSWNVGHTVYTGGCPGQWLDRNFVYYGPDKDYIYDGEDVSDLIGGSNPAQIAMAATDMCNVWYLVQGNCAAHTPSPWIDNVRLQRYKTAGPQWTYRDLDFFQDNFPWNEFDLTSYVEADASNDINTNDNPVIRPGDSIVVGCSSLLGGGLAADPTYGGRAIYLHVKAQYIGPAPAKPNLFGPSLAGSTIHGTSPAITVNYQYISDDGALWTVIQCDTARTGSGTVADKYCVDLNDQLFTRGYQISYYFTAKDNAGVETALPGWARSGGPYFEFTCLPTQNSDVLFVNDFAHRGTWNGTVEDYWKPVFNAVLASPNNNVDIYHVNGPTSGVSNGPGSRAKNMQLTSQYYKIVWDSGDLNAITITDGTVKSDKSNDCQMLIDWMDLATHACGLWICGDGIAYDLATNDASTPALTLMNSKCGVSFKYDSYFDQTGGRTGGGVITPLITGDTDAGIFVHSGVPDKFYAFGGCFIINLFDCLDKTAGGKWALDYPVYASTAYHAAISNDWTNPAGFDVRTMWFGFSYMYVRNDVVSAPIDAYEIANDVFKWMQNPTNVNITPAVTPKSYNLAQNFPNPFNPSTTIKYDMKDKGLVTLKVYNVAGQLVRTLSNSVKNAGSYTVTWDGKNDRGGSVASGIYFYKMDTKDFSQTKKMVMLR